MADEPHAMSDWVHVGLSSQSGGHRSVVFPDVKNDEKTAQDMLTMHQIRPEGWHVGMEENGIVFPDYGLDTSKGNWISVTVLRPIFWYERRPGCFVSDVPYDDFLDALRTHYSKPCALCDAHRETMKGKSKR